MTEDFFAGQSIIFAGILGKSFGKIIQSIAEKELSSDIAEVLKEVQ